MKKKTLTRWGITLFAVILALLWLIPLIWMIGTAFSVPSFHMTLFPTTPFTLDNLHYVWNAIPFATYYLNTLTLVVYVPSLSSLSPPPWQPTPWELWILRDPP